MTEFQPIPPKLQPKLNGPQSKHMKNNRIEKFENIQSIKDAHQLTELALDGNPVTNKEGYFQFCIKNCPTLKNLDMMKITQEMRENNGIPTEMDKAKQAAA